MKKRCGYDVKKEIGQGSFGEVSLISDDKGDLFAFKKLANGKFGMTSLNEINILMSVEHENVLKGYKVYNSKNCDINDTGVVTELLTMSLGSYIKHNRRKENYKDNIIKIMKDVYSGVYALHDLNILHLDIKPDNILIELDEKDNVVKAVIGDLGSCIYSNDITKLRRYRSTISTPIYEPVERLDKNVCDAKTDVYSLALSFVECFDRRTIFNYLVDDNDDISAANTRKFIRNREKVYRIILKSLKPYFKDDKEELLTYVDMLWNSINRHKSRSTLRECLEVLDVKYESPSLSTYTLGKRNYDIIERVSKLIIEGYRDHVSREQFTLAVDILYTHMTNKRVRNPPDDLILANTYNLIAIKSLRGDVIKKIEERNIFMDVSEKDLDEILDFELRVVSDLNGLVNSDRPFYHKNVKTSVLIDMMTKPEEYVELFNSEV